jgi:beta-glucanase (GH16 family)
MASFSNRSVIKRSLAKPTSAGFLNFLPSLAILSCLSVFVPAPAAAQTGQAALERQLKTLEQELQQLNQKFASLETTPSTGVTSTSTPAGTAPQNVTKLKYRGKEYTEVNGVWSVITRKGTTFSGINGACGSTNGKAAGTAPTADSYGTGTVSAVVGSGLLTCTCAGTGGDPSASCSAPIIVDGKCGRSSDAATTPTTGLCTAGTASTVNGNDPWTWSCNSTNGGIAASCTTLLEAGSTGTGSGTITSPVTLPTLPTWTSGSISSGGNESSDITIYQSSQPLQTAPPGATINVQTNFSAVSPLSTDDPMAIYLVNASGTTVTSVRNTMNTRNIYIGTSIWVGPISFPTQLTLPGNIAAGTYYVMVGLYNGSGAPLQLTPGPGVTQDNRYRYYVGAIKISASGAAPSLLAPPSVDTTGYAKTFDDEFTTLSISDSSTNDGSTWYATNEQCCMSDTTGAGAAMGGFTTSQNPFSLVRGGGLDIRLHLTNNTWYGGVLTSVDGKGIGFSQQYGYFVMSAVLPSGEDTWPAFWLLNTSNLSSGTAGGEIDILEYIANRGFIDYIMTTLHDWIRGQSNVHEPFIHTPVHLPSDGNYHTYSMLWTAQTMTFYYDDSMYFKVPTPAVMRQPYYLIVNLGIGSGWPTNNTPPVNDMLVKYIRAYTVP